MRVSRRWQWRPDTGQERARIRFPHRSRWPVPRPRIASMAPRSRAPSRRDAPRTGNTARSLPPSKAPTAPRSGTIATITAATSPASCSRRRRTSRRLLVAAPTRRPRKALAWTGHGPRPRARGGRCGASTRAPPASPETENCPAARRFPPIISSRRHPENIARARSARLGRVPLPRRRRARRPRRCTAPCALLG